MTSWDWLTFITKVAIYLGTAGVIGGLFSLWLLQHHNRQRLLLAYVRCACVLGLVATLVYFPVQVGAFADRGMTGMLDWDIAGILHQTGVGDTSRGRLLGFLLVWVGSLGLLNHRPMTRITSRFNVVLGVFALLYAYTAIGHLYETGVVGRALVALHLLAVSLWLGSLYPLWKISRGSGIAKKSRRSPQQTLNQQAPNQQAAIQNTMQRFGRVAVIIVAALVISGLWMALLLLTEPMHLLTTDYGRGLLLKMLLVGGLLLLAAANKWWLVPRLHMPGYLGRLSRSIQCEMLIGCLIVLTIGYITTVTGPAN